MSNQVGVGIVGAALKVRLLNSDNEYLTYPALGVIEIQEIGVTNEIINAVFRQIGKDGRLGAPVEVRNPTFIYYRAA